ncbi:GNAT family N-acetyltransferase [Catellatospora vulcania]|uniref:GNAT family N-acetyltransferase n=1 Tax=Catellatospora vulcania TaxID=1460450 RepID=UPI001E6152F7|nr:GNAT family N-acetyltransferase [Catellatospora vulcania]
MSTETATMEIIEVSPADPRLAPLVGAMRVELDALYPEEIDFEHPTVREAARFLLVLAGGAAVGCCAVQPLDGGEAELKRMYVVPAWRGRGIARRLMPEAEALAVRAGARRMKLETGVRQPEAIAVYERAGFTRIPNYPPYDRWEMSVCYAKPLPA